MTKRSVCSVVAGFAALVITSCSAPSHRTGAAERAIIGGTTDTGDPSVVSLIAQTGQMQALCTAEVIAPTVLLTAAHCVDPAETGAGAQFFVIEGTDVQTGVQGPNVSATHFDPMFDTNNPNNGHDIGIVILASDIGLQSMPYNLTPMTQQMVGLSVRLVGYGLSNATAMTGAGTKRQVTTVLDDFDSLLLHIGTTGKDSCNGDSGGPALMTLNGVETIVGVTSFGDQNCTGGGYYTRIDDYGAFISQYVGACTPMCAGKICGPDGCGGTCGACTGGQACNATGTGCTCAPQCAGKNCGGDGCGGTCGSCGPNETCGAGGVCMTGCTPQCNGKACGPNGCGGSCGTCGTGEMCSTSGQCMSVNACDAAGGVETEPNDVQSQAGQLCSNFMIRASIGTPDDMDWFTWSTAQDHDYTVHLTSLSHDTEMSLFKVLSGEIVYLTDGDNNHDNADQSISRHSETGGTYYLLVRGLNGAFDQNGSQYQVQITSP
jgi:V8-like Glu-specific endopeptidase